MSSHAKCHFQSVFGANHTMLLGFLVLAIFSLSGGASGIDVEAKLDFQSDKPTRPRFLEKVYLAQKKEEKRDEFDKIGVVCVKGGCNTTKSEGSDPISTDIVVEVKTNIDLNENKNKNKTQIEEIPDVPIILGYAGTNEISNNINTVDNAINPVTNIGNAFPSLMNGNSFYPSAGIPVADVDIRPLITPNDANYKNVYQVPYYSNTDHFFNENRPSNFWYSRSNPSGFYNKQKTDWRGTPTWYNRRSGYNYNRDPTTPTPWTTCTCHPNNPWRPTTPFYRTLNQQLGTQINSKLAPLN